ncbi:MAG: hypothetical protein ACREIC_09610, partial [Limisphaerales bacterium]
MTGSARAQKGLSPMTFSQFAENEMWSLFKNHADQVGSKYIGSDGAGKAKTDCITYVRQVLEYAFAEVPDPNGADGVRRNYEKGTKLAQFLVGLPGWKAYYWNPDVKDPADGRSEHPVSYKLAQRTGSYYTVPVSGFVINYKLTRRTRKKDRGPNDMADFNRLSRVRFGYGLA